MPAKLSDIDALVIASVDYPKDAVPYARATGDPDMATAIVETDRGVYPSDPDAVADFLEVAKSVENAALKKYLKWKRSSGAEGARLLAEYNSARQRASRLFDHIVDGISDTADGRE